MRTVSVLSPKTAALWIRTRFLAFYAGAGAQEVVPGVYAPSHYTHARTALPPTWTQAARDFHCSNTFRPDDGARHSDWREESGEPGFLPERDGVLNCLLLGTSWRKRVSRSAIGSGFAAWISAHYYGRRDLHIPEDVKQNAIQRARTEVTQTLVVAIAF